MKALALASKIVEKYWLLFVFLGGLVAASASLLLSVGQPIWFDEGYSILLAKQQYGELLSLTAVDAHPPFYYLLLKVWGDIVGFSEGALRSLSALLMGGSVVVAGVLLRRLFSTRVAIVALPFIIFAPFLLRYGYEVRMYALATLIAVTATNALVRARAAEGWRWWAVYAALVALGMYTLYMMIAVWVAHFVWLLVVSIKSKERPFWRWTWLYAFAAAVVLFLPYLKTFIYQLTHSALPGMGNEMTVPQLTNIVSTLFLYTPEWSLGGWGTVILLLAVVPLAVVGVSVYRGLDMRKKQGFMLLVALAVVPVLFYALVSLPPRDPVFIVRYMAHSAVFIYMLTGVIIALALLKKERSKSATATLLAVGVFIVFVVGVGALQKAGNFNFERMQKPLTYVVHDAAQCENTQIPVIADDPYTYIDSAFYFQGCQLYFYSKEDIAYKGGYAMLHESERRIASPGDLTAPVIVHLGWKGNDPQFKPDKRYVLIESRTFDKQVVRRYQLIAE